MDFLLGIKTPGCMPVYACVDFHVYHARISTSVTNSDSRIFRLVFFDVSPARESLTDVGKLCLECVEGTSLLLIHQFEVPHITAHGMNLLAILQQLYSFLGILEFEVPSENSLKDFFKQNSFLEDGDRLSLKLLPCEQCVFLFETPDQIGSRVSNLNNFLSNLNLAEEMTLTDVRMAVQSQVLFLRRVLEHVSSEAVQRFLQWPHGSEYEYSGRIDGGPGTGQRSSQAAQQPSRPEPAEQPTPAEQHEPCSAPELPKSTERADDDGAELPATDSKRLENLSSERDDEASERDDASERSGAKEQPETADVSGAVEHETEQSDSGTRESGQGEGQERLLSTRKRKSKSSDFDSGFNSYGMLLGVQCRAELWSHDKSISDMCFFRGAGLSGSISEPFPLQQTLQFTRLFFSRRPAELDALYAAWCIGVVLLNMTTVLKPFFRRYSGTFLMWVVHLKKGRSWSKQGAQCWDNVRTKLLEVGTESQVDDLFETLKTIPAQNTRLRNKMSLASSSYKLPLILFMILPPGDLAARSLNIVHAFFLLTFEVSVAKREFPEALLEGMVACSNWLDKCTKPNWTPEFEAATSRWNLFTARDADDVEPSIECTLGQSAAGLAMSKLTTRFLGCDAAESCQQQDHAACLHIVKTLSNSQCKMKCVGGFPQSKLDSEGAQATRYITKVLIQAPDKTEFWLHDTLLARGLVVTCANFAIGSTIEELKTFLSLEPAARARGIELRAATISDPAFGGHKAQVISNGVLDILKGAGLSDSEIDDFCLRDFCLLKLKNMDTPPLCYTQDDIPYSMWMSTHRTKVIEVNGFSCEFFDAYAIPPEAYVNCYKFWGEGDLPSQPQYVGDPRIVKAILGRTVHHLETGIRKVLEFRNKPWFRDPGSKGEGSKFRVYKRKVKRGSGGEGGGELGGHAGGGGGEPGGQPGPSNREEEESEIEEEDSGED